ncbi:MAG TPA: transketolase [Burkholderiales bacterium]|nr:transketolase [Burkholderiales bacterium]
MSQAHSRAIKPVGLDAAAARQRCLGYRRRILEISQQVTALHIAPAFSCLEMVDVVYHDLMRRDAGSSPPVFLDSFVISKGHGCLSQYVILEDFGVLTRADLDCYCTPAGRLGAHPDYGVPGMEASTGSLGHGMGICTGMAYAEKIQRRDRNIYVVLSDGEMQEGSTWESMMMAANLGLGNLIALLDLNDFQGMGRTSVTHPKFYPILDKVQAFGWDAAEVNGHDAAAIYDAVNSRQAGRPFFLVGRTVKGRGVSYMENAPIWHYRSPSREEYQQALDELKEISS